MNEETRVTIKEVAEAIHKSKSTISRAIKTLGIEPTKEGQTQYLSREQLISILEYIKPEEYKKIKERREHTKKNDEHEGKGIIKQNKEKKDEAVTASSASQTASSASTAASAETKAASAASFDRFNQSRSASAASYIDAYIAHLEEEIRHLREENTSLIQINGVLTAKMALIEDKKDSSKEIIETPTDDKDEKEINKGSEVKEKGIKAFFKRRKR